jgi:hypothetical protein
MSASYRDIATYAYPFPQHTSTRAIPRLSQRTSEIVPTGQTREHAHLRNEKEVRLICVGGFQIQRWTKDGCKIAINYAVILRNPDGFEIESWHIRLINCPLIMQSVNELSAEINQIQFTTLLIPQFDNLFRHVGFNLRPVNFTIRIQ